MQLLFSVYLTNIAYFAAAESILISVSLVHYMVVHSELCFHC